VQRQIRSLLINPDWAAYIDLPDYLALDGDFACLANLAETIKSDDLPVDEFETLGGFVFDLFGKIPAKYEKTAWNDFDFIVQDMDGHKVKTVKIVHNKNSMQN